MPGPLRELAPTADCYRGKLLPVSNQYPAHPPRLDLGLALSGTATELDWYRHAGARCNVGKSAPLGLPSAASCSARMSGGTALRKAFMASARSARSSS